MEIVGAEIELINSVLVFIKMSRSGMLQLTDCWGCVHRVYENAKALA